jgi:hypothetical protein
MAEGALDHALAEPAQRFAQETTPTCWRCCEEMTMNIR